MIETEAIRKVLESVEEGIASHNVDQIVSNFTSDGIIMIAHIPALVGHEAIRAVVTQMASMVQSKVEATFVDEKQLSEDVFQTHFTRKGTRTIKATGKETEIKEQGVAVLRRVDGEWKVASVVTNTLLPPPSM